MTQCVTTPDRAHRVWAFSRWVCLWSSVIAALGVLALAIVSIERPLGGSDFLRGPRYAAHFNISGGCTRIQYIRTARDGDLPLASPAGWARRATRRLPLAGPWGFCWKWQVPRTRREVSLRPLGYANLTGSPTSPARVLFTARVSELAFPLWAPLFVFSLYPAYRFMQGPLRQYRRRHRNQCIECGYSLKGNTSGICPECGTPIPENVKQGLTTNEPELRD